MTQLPPPLLAQLDQDKAGADRAITAMVDAVRADLAEGHDPTYVWSVLVTQTGHADPAKVAAVLAAALLRLA